MKNPNPVDAFFMQKGFKPSLAFLGETAFEIGKQIQTQSFCLSYYFDGRRFIITAFNQTLPRFGLSTALRSLLTLLKQLLSEVPEVEEIASVLQWQPNPSTRASMEKWAKRLEQLGAQRGIDPETGASVLSYSRPEPAAVSSVTPKQSSLAQGTLESA